MVVSLRNAQGFRFKPGKAEAPADDEVLVPKRSSKYWTKVHRQCVMDMADEQVENLTGILGVHPDSIRSFEWGWHKKKKVWTVPERDDRGRIIGIATRSEDGTKGFLLGGQRGVTIADDFARRFDVTLVVEGASDAVACHSMGINVIGRPSNTFFRYLSAHLQGREFIVLGENDSKPNGKWPGRDGAISVSAHLAQDMQREIQWAFPPWQAKDVRDAVQRKRHLSMWRDWRRLGRRFLVDVRDQLNVVKPVPVRFHIYSGKEIMEQAPPEYQIETLFAMRNLVVLYGAPGCGKTFIVLAWALSIVNAAHWLGLSCRRGRVVYVAAEGAGSLGLRLQAWQRGNADFSACDIGLITDAPNLLVQDDVEALIRSLKEYQPQLVVVDTLARTMPGGDENHAKDMGLYVDALIRIRNEVGSSVIVVHHSGKDDQRERGSSALRGAADCVIRIQANKLGGLQLKCEKAKDAEEFKPIRFALRTAVVGDTTSCYVATPNLIYAGPEKRASIKEKILKALTDARSAGLGGLTFSQLRGQCGGPKTTFQTARKGLLTEGLIEKFGPKERTLYRATLPTPENAKNAVIQGKGE